LKIPLKAAIETTVLHVMLDIVPLNTVSVDFKLSITMGGDNACQEILVFVQWPILYNVF
jgi:hypothetical protein